MDNMTGLLGFINEIKKLENVNVGSFFTSNLSSTTQDASAYEKINYSGNLTTTVIGESIEIPNAREIAFKIKGNVKFAVMIASGTFRKTTGETATNNLYLTMHRELIEGSSSVSKTSIARIRNQNITDTGYRQFSIIGIIPQTSFSDENESELVYLEKQGFVEVSDLSAVLITFNDYSI